MKTPHDPKHEPNDRSHQSWLHRQMSNVKRWAKHLKTETQVLASAARDPRVAWSAKLIVAIVVAYALSPIDLIPDFIPILGYLDDLVIVPLGIALAIRMIPKDVLAEHRARVTTLNTDNKPSRTGAAIVIALWIITAALVIWFFV